VTIRIKLTVGFMLAMSVVLGVTGLFLYLRFAGELNHTIDRGLHSQVEAVKVLIAQSDTGLRESGSGLAARSATFAQVLRAGRVIDFTRPLSRPLLGHVALARAARGPITLERRAVPGVDQAVRLLAAPVTGQDGRAEVAVVGTVLTDRDHALSVLAALLALGGTGALLLAGGVGYLLSTIALRTVESMRRRAQTLSLSDAGGRLPLPRSRDELWRLGRTLNEMLARNEAAYARERAFVADASHELRSPLTVLRTELEMALRAGTGAAEMRRALSSASEESEHLSQLADDLLAMTGADQSPDPVRTTFPARELLSGSTQRFEAAAGRQGRQIVWTDQAELTLHADREGLQRAVLNLLENALRYGAGTITVSANVADGAVELHVCDEGPGFAPAFLPSAFERFSRAERGRTTDGSGLGLAIVAAIAQAHGGQAHAANRNGGGGADVWISLPAVGNMRPR
jgi:signal transduction histidine kinase